MEIEKDFAVSGRNYKAGTYKLRTMIKDGGTVKLENLNGLELQVSINTLVKADFKRLELNGFELTGIKS